MNFVQKRLLDIAYFGMYTKRSQFFDTLFELQLEKNDICVPETDMLAVKHVIGLLVRQYTNLFP